MAKVTFNFDTYSESFCTVVSAAASYLVNLDRVWIRLDKEPWRQEGEADMLASEIGVNHDDEKAMEIVKSFVKLCADAQETGNINLADARVLAGNTYRYMRERDRA